MTIVWTVSCRNHCLLLCTLDKAEAIRQAQQRGLILDAISCRSEEAVEREMARHVVDWCECEEED